MAAERGWQRKFDDPIETPDGRALVTLRDAATYVTGLPKREASLPERIAHRHTEDRSWPFFAELPNYLGFAEVAGGGIARAAKRAALGLKHSVGSPAATPSPLTTNGSATQYVTSATAVARYGRTCRWKPTAASHAHGGR